ncbi:hypothetical protein [Paenibacillus tyrfis]|uniref:Uncharacterized protein n=1 Tax=Paenibacillus tyrfis TaxID=1501230 RepID=A0A081P2C0_9BACL|nr:hypothetical protein [Paenibacillus tyrfis]KEQ24843.1 hypothetical protein ET33_07180 [Paenibacillus tyrfis]
MAVNIRKSVLSASLALTLCLSGSSVSADAPKETEQSLFINDTIVLTEKKKNDIEKLESFGLPKDIIQKLGNDVDVVAREISVNNLNMTQATNLSNGLIRSNLRAKEVAQGKYDPKEMYFAKAVNGEVTLPNGHTIAVPSNARNKISSKNTEAALESCKVWTGKHCVDTGPYFNIDANTGFSKVSAMVTLPSVYSASYKGVVPYVLAGIFYKRGEGDYPDGVDLGAFWEDGRWRLCINGGKDKEDQTKDLWVSGQVDLPSQVYLVYKIPFDGQVQIDAFDPITYNPISGVSYWLPGRGFNQNGNNIEMSSGFSLAFKNVKNLTDGSYLRGGRFSNAYLYNNNFSTLWTSNYTAHRDKKRTDDEARTVQYNPNSYDYDYSVDINLNLP